MPKRKGYDPDWDKPETIAAFLKEFPPTMTACSMLLRDMAEEASTPLHQAWFLAAAQLLAKSA